MQTYYLGIDIGGTKTAIGLYDRSFERFDGLTLKTEAEKGCDDLVSRIGASFDALLEQNGIVKSQVVSAGAAAPGPIDLKTGTIKFIPTMGFRNENIAMKLTRGLGLPVFVEKDTNAAVLCESVFGKWKNEKVITYITVSTGIGCATAVDKQVIWGSTCSAGELGHIKSVRNGRECACGGYGCLEQYASGSGMERAALRLTGRAYSAKEIFEKAGEGDKVCLEIVQTAAEELGYGIAMIVQFIEPDVIILGGSVTNDYDTFHPFLTAAVECYTQHIEGREIKLAVSEFGGEQVMKGAAYYGAISR